MESRKSSVSKIPKISTNKDQVSKTEALYQRARAAMSKLQTSSVVVNNIPKPQKPQSKPKESSKPPLNKRSSQAVLEVIKKQQQIRKNFNENRGSFQHTNTRNHKSSSQIKENKSMRTSQERTSKNKLLAHKSSKQEENNQDNEHKQVKKSHITRKEARAQIGLGDIPDEKIEEIIKHKKEKLKTVENSEHTHIDYNNVTESVPNNSRSRVGLKTNFSKSKTEEIK